LYSGNAFNVIGMGEVRRREECYTALQTGHLLCHSKARVGVLVIRKREDHYIDVNSINRRISKYVVCITTRYKLNSACICTTSFKK